MEGITRKQIEQTINAIDSEDVLKYFPSLLVRTLNNADVNGFTYQSVSKFFTADVRVVWKINKTVTVAVGIDNVNNYQYWNFHPYPQRSYQANLRADF